MELKRPHYINLKIKKNEEFVEILINISVKFIVYYNHGVWDARDILANKEIISWIVLDFVLIKTNGRK